MAPIAPELLTILRDYCAIDRARARVTITVRFDDRDPDSPYANRLDLFKQLMTLLTSLGGTYRSSGKRTGAYVFQFDPTDLIAGVLAAGEVNPLALFETPAAVADQLVALHPDLRLWCTRLGIQGEWLPADQATDADDLRACVTELPVILEPSAGRGALIRALQRAGYIGRILAVEIDPTNLMLLRQAFGDDPLITIIPGDILTVDLSPYGPIDGAIMNPPFDAPGGANSLLYIDHIRYVARLLRARHHVAAITPVSWRFRSQAKAQDFHEWVQETGSAESLGKGSFVESGFPGEIWLVTGRNNLPSDAPGPWPIWADPADQFPSYRCGHLDIAMQAGDVAQWASVHAIWRQLRDGALPLDLFGAATPETRAAILAFYQQLADTLMQTEGLLIQLRPHEQTWMVDWFLEQYQTALAEGRIEEPVTLRRSAAQSWRRQHRAVHVN